MSLSLILSLVFKLFSYFPWSFLFPFLKGYFNFSHFWQATAYEVGVFLVVSIVMGVLGWYLGSKVKNDMVASVWHSKSFPWKTMLIVIGSGALFGGAVCYLVSTWFGMHSGSTFASLLSSGAACGLPTGHLLSWAYQLLQWARK